MKELSKGFSERTQTAKKRLTKGIDVSTKDFPELLRRTVNTQGASIFIWRTVNPLMSSPSRLSNLYSYEIRRLSIDSNTLGLLEALNDGIYLKLIGFLWESSTPTNMNIKQLVSQEFLGIGIDIDAFAQCVQRRLVNVGKYNINKRKFYVVGNKRVK